MTGDWSAGGGSGSLCKVRSGRVPSFSSHENLKWTSEDTAVATITAGGEATGLKAGTTKITATYTNADESVQIGTATLEVTEPTALSITVTPSSGNECASKTRKSASG